MKLPVWAWDHKKQRYVLFPFDQLVTLPNGKKGIVVGWHHSNPGLAKFLEDRNEALLRRFPNNFGKIIFFHGSSLAGHEYVPTSPQRKNKQLEAARKPKHWYATLDDKGQIKGYQHPRRKK